MPTRGKHLYSSRGRAVIIATSRTLPCVKVTGTSKYTHTHKRTHTRLAPPSRPPNHLHHADCFVQAGTGVCQKRAGTAPCEEGGAAGSACRRRERRLRSFLRRDRMASAVAPRSSTAPQAGLLSRKWKWCSGATHQGDDGQSRGRWKADFVMDHGVCDELSTKTVVFVALPVADNALLLGDGFRTRRGRLLGWWSIISCSWSWRCSGTSGWIASR